LGVTLYLLLTDQLPFNIDPDLGWTNTKAFEVEPPPPGSLNIEVDSALENIVLRCLQFDPTNRYRDARELLEALNAWRKQTQSQKIATKQTISSEPSKTTLGFQSPMDSEEGKRLANLAIKKAKQEGHLFEAADLMEEAFNKSPWLREKYAGQVRLWRCGISM
jgi:serine/threonine protein kinase